MYFSKGFQFLPSWTEILVGVGINLKATQANFGMEEFNLEGPGEVKWHFCWGKRFLSILDEAMNFIISSILSKRPKKERIRPGTPWYRAESPARPDTPVNVHDSKNGNINRSDTPARSIEVVERRKCC